MLDSRIALRSGDRAYSYGRLAQAAGRAAAGLLNGEAELGEARVAYLVPPGFEWVALTWGIWRARGIAVPLALSHPAAELEHVLRDADVSIAVAHPGRLQDLAPLAQKVGARLLSTTELVPDQEVRSVDLALPDGEWVRDRALILYTSGTTGKPKGVVHTHATLAAQIHTLIDAWSWSAQDRTLLVLPLHHVHGIVNVLSCALASGASCEVMPRFDAQETWQRLASGELTVFMAVPTIYHRLIACWEAAPPAQQRAWSGGARQLRLMVSGSAALPVSTLNRWRDITGHTLLERYGMTEIGMALSNPLHGERRAGSVGMPLPGVQVRLVDESGAEVASGTPGEIEVRGPAVFQEYWRRPEATRGAFRPDPTLAEHDRGWFRTGDVAVVESGYHRILGRTSIDIIKTAGYKVSALEIEEVLRTHPAITECAVVGVSDLEWGERVCAAVETRAQAVLTLSELQEWARPRLAPYKIPRALLCVSALPRNAMGKVIKPEVGQLFS